MCAVTGCTTLEPVRASHVKPWSRSSNAERLDPANGLPLIATLDALFDRGLSTFGPDWNMLVSSRIDHNERQPLGIPAPLIKRPSRKTAHFMEIHRELIFKA